MSASRSEGLMRKPTPPPIDAGSIDPPCDRQALRRPDTEADPGRPRRSASIGPPMRCDTVTRPLSTRKYGVAGSKEYMTSRVASTLNVVAFSSVYPTFADPTRPRNPSRPGRPRRELSEAHRDSTRDHGVRRKLHAGHHAHAVRVTNRRGIEPVPLQLHVDRDSRQRREGIPHTCTATSAGVVELIGKGHALELLIVAIVLRRAAVRSGQRSDARELQFDATRDADFLAEHAGVNLVPCALARMVERRQRETAAGVRSNLRTGLRRAG